MARVLLFEDNPINSKMMKMFLEQSGYYVELALSFNELQTKVTHSFDLLFIDVSSPALDMELLAEFVHRAKQGVNCPPIVAVMNNAKDAEIKYYLQIGMDGYITKPISVKSLRETIEIVRSGKVTPAPGEDFVDVDKLSGALGISDRKMLVNLFEQFFKNIQEEVPLMQSAAMSKDYNALRNISHNIKGASRNLRLTNLGKLAEEIEGQTKYPSASLDIMSMINDFASACERVYNDFCNKYSK
ncbi:MAG: response regulator [Deferribacteraceae bacterium]|jgi:CheY-like chemotaxis protein/HPt (histidine-containing phosphotransfer) domain-containing protein|nr:response regulator [Deferribacteraceae bacterium]